MPLTAKLTHLLNTSMYGDLNIQSIPPLVQLETTVLHPVTCHLRDQYPPCSNIVGWKITLPVLILLWECNWTTAFVGSSNSGRKSSSKRNQIKVYFALTWTLILPKKNNYFMLQSIKPLFFSLFLFLLKLGKCIYLFIYLAAAYCKTEF